MKNRFGDLSLAVVMLGATGAVGSETLKSLLSHRLKSLTLLGRRKVPNIKESYVLQHELDVTNSNSYSGLLQDHQVAICTLGVGEPSKVSKEDFLKIDKIAVLNFAKACKIAGVSHFQLLSSVGISSKSSSFFLRTKGELVDELVALDFERLSIFQPSMILTPSNRYGFIQALTLRVWPLLKPLLLVNLRKFRGVPVDVLGKAIAANVFTGGQGTEMLLWDDFYELIKN